MLKSLPFLTFALECLLLISNAYAQISMPSMDSSSLTSFLPLILMFVVLYFLMIRPQMKRQKEQRTMMEALSKGDEIVTSGGLLGKITKINDSYLTVEISSENEVVIQKSAVVTLLPKGTLKSL